MEFRPVPFVILNDEYPEGRGERQLSALMERLHAAGYGGGYFHARPGLITEYLSARWFELIRHCVRESRRLGMTAHLYDENSYPSGFGGGHVPALAPETKSRFVSFIRGEGREALPPSFLSLHEWVVGEELPREAPIGVGEVEPETPWVALVEGVGRSSAWYGETNYTSLIDPRTAEVFLATTYDAYHRELGELWDSVPSIFTDEPNLSGYDPGPWSPGLHWTPYFLGQFRIRKGYDLRPHLVTLFFDTGDCREVRYHFYDLMHQLWMENWALPLERWCQGRGIRLTGHYLEHNWPCPYATPGHVHLLAHMDWPGSDMLGSYLLKGHDFYDVSGFDPVPPGMEPHGLYYLRQVGSVANQLGKERTVNECWGGGGHESTPADWMRIARWLIVNGVNLLVPHSSWDTVRGARKWDYPPNFAPQSPWFDHLRPLNEELARLCWIATRGEAVNRLLVVDALTSGFCLSAKSESSHPDAIEAVENPSSKKGAMALPKVDGLRRAANRFAQALAEAQVDYDLGDEYVMEEFGESRGGYLRVGKQSYALVVLSPGLMNLRSQTVDLLEVYLASGGRVLGVGESALLVDGAPSARWEALLKRYGSRITFFQEADTLLAAMIREVPPRLVFEEGGSRLGVLHHYRRLPDGELFLIVNSSPETFRAVALIATEYRAVSLLDPKSGEVERGVWRQEEGGLRLEIAIPAGGARVIRTGSFAVEGMMRGVASEGLLELLRIERVSPNVAVLDVAELEVGGERFPMENVARVNERYWALHGLTTNGWNGVIQYRDQLVSRDAFFDDRSGGTVGYEIEIAPGVELSGCSLVVECASLWQVKVNGERLAFETGETFRDPRFERQAVGHLLRHGRNRVELIGCPFSVRQEIAPIYLLGDFHCEPCEVGFRMVPSQRLKLGSWRSQGLPFYDDAMSYHVRLRGPATRISLPPECWGGSFAIVRQERREIGRIFESPWRLDLPQAISGEVEIVIIGLPCHLLGPWHDADAPSSICSPHQWVGPRIKMKPQPGECYRLPDLGLFSLPGS